METEENKPLKRGSRFSSGLYRRRITVFLICIVLSSFFWVISALSKTYTSEIDYPIRFENIPLDHIPANQIPENIRIKVKTQGFRLLKYHFFDNPRPIPIDLTHLNSSYDFNREYAYHFSQAILTFREKLGPEVEILEFLPDAVNLIFDRKDTRMIPVVSRTKLSFGKQYRLAGQIITEPDSLLVSGPASIIDTLPAIYTEEFLIEDLKNTLETNLKVISPDERVKIETNSVKVVVPVSRYTEESAECIVYPNQVPANSEIEFFPKSCAVYYRVNFSDYNKINPGSFHVAAKISAGSTKASIQIDKKPDYVEIIRIDPPTVEYIISHRE
ncbi:MAG: YbbR-like domain-containing protein [Bacteroidetes bacterium]|nr:YbbR-like domain-containing protein [Bacteroidota bacterium]